MSQARDPTGAGVNRRGGVSSDRSDLGEPLGSSGRSTVSSESRARSGNRHRRLTVVATHDHEPASVVQHFQRLLEPTWYSRSLEHDVEPPRERVCVLVTSPVMLPTASTT